MADCIVRKIKDIETRYDKYVKIDNKEMLNLSSNDYLALSTKKDFIEEFMNDIGKDYLFSSASARLLSGTEKIYKDLETLLAQIFNKEKALIYNTGYQCNLGVISALNKKGDVVFSDKLNHASIIDGMRLSDGEFFRYNHLNYDHLEEILKKHRANFNNAIIVSESIFSMDGDVADISRLVELKQKYNCKLMIDEAHAFMAIEDEFGGGISKNNNVDIVTATFGKALGSFGAFVVANNDIINQLINTSRSFIFSTAIPPINIAWTYWILTKKQEFITEQKLKLCKLTANVHAYFKNIGYQLDSMSYIIPIILGESAKAEALCEQLQAMGFYVLPIRPPTVPVGTARLRISLTADITFEELRPMLDKIANELNLAK